MVLSKVDIFYFCCCMVMEIGQKIFFRIECEISLDKKIFIYMRGYFCLQKSIQPISFCVYVYGIYIIWND